LGGSCDGVSEVDASLPQGASQIVAQIQEISPAGRFAADQDEIDAADAMLRQFKPRGFFQAAARAVADHRAADFLGDGEADAGRISRGFLGRGALHGGLSEV
jgi:hypothetical protein